MITPRGCRKRCRKSHEHSNRQRQPSRQQRQLSTRMLGSKLKCRPPSRHPPLLKIHRDRSVAMADCAKARPGCFNRRVQLTRKRQVCQHGFVSLQGFTAGSCVISVPYASVPYELKYFYSIPRQNASVRA